MVVFLMVVAAVIALIVLLVIRSSRAEKAAKKREEELLAKAVQGDSQAKIDFIEFYISRCLGASREQKELLRKVSQGDSNSILALADIYEKSYLETPAANLKMLISLYERIVEHGNAHHVAAIERAFKKGAFTWYSRIRMFRSALAQNGYTLGDYSYHSEHLEGRANSDVSYVSFDISDSTGAKCGDITFSAGFSYSIELLGKKAKPRNGRGSHHIICVKDVPIIIKSNTPCIDPPADWMIACARIFAVSCKTLSLPDWAKACEDPEEFINVAFRYH